MLEPVILCKLFKFIATELRAVVTDHYLRNPIPCQVGFDVVDYSLVSAVKQV